MVEQQQHHHHLLPNPNNGGNQNKNSKEVDKLRIFNNGIEEEEELFHDDDIDSTCSTPYVSAPSSPGRCGGPNGYFYSAPASPMHYVLSSSSAAAAAAVSSSSSSSSGSFEFEFSARFPSNSSVVTGSMSTADELFLNGQIRPMKLSSHLQRPQILAPLLDLEDVEEDAEEDDVDGVCSKREDSMLRGRELRLRNRSLHRRTRSLSPLRNASWHEDDDEEEVEEVTTTEEEEEERDLDLVEKRTISVPSTGETPSVSASSSRSSSSGSRNSKRWVFLKEFLRSKSEGRGSVVKEKFWHSISFSPSSANKEKKKKSSSSLQPSVNETQKAKRKQQQQQPISSKKSVTGNGKPTNGVGKRRIPPSPHELLYTSNRAQAEEMRKKTYLPYRQGLFGCLGFSSKGYGAMNAFTRSLNPVSTR